MIKKHKGDMPYWPNCNSNANDFLERGGSLQDFFFFFALNPSGENGFKCSDTCVLGCRSVLQGSAPLGGWGVGGRLLCYSSQADLETWHSALSPEVELLAVLHCEEQSLLLQQLRNWSIAQLTHLMEFLNSS